MLLHSNRTGRIDSNRPGESSAAFLALVRPVNEGIYSLRVPVDARLTGIYRSFGVEMDDADTDFNDVSLRESLGIPTLGTTIYFSTVRAIGHEDYPDSSQRPRWMPR
jgi:hypothetical protein